MKKCLRTVAISVVLIALFSTSLFAEEQEVKKSETGAYLLTIFLGFGAGHYYIQSDHATRFLVLQLLPTAVAIGGGVYMGMAVANLDLQGVVTGSIILYGGLAVFLGVHIWQIVDVIIEVDKKRAEGKIARLEPRIEIQPTGVAVSLSYRY
jgi:hypothetical protein